MSLIDKHNYPGATWPVTLYDIGGQLLPAGRSDGRVHAIWPHIPEPSKEYLSPFDIAELAANAFPHHYISSILGNLAIVKELPLINGANCLATLTPLWTDNHENNNSWVERIVHPTDNPPFYGYRKRESGTQVAVTTLRDIREFIPFVGLRPSATG